MPDLILGSFEALIRAHGGIAPESKESYHPEFLLQEASGSTPQKVQEAIVQDFNRCNVLAATSEENQSLYAMWIDLTQTNSNYAQGMIDGGNLHMLLSNFILLRQQESDEAKENYLNSTNPNHVQIRLGYINENNQLCALSLRYFKDDPSRWMIGHVTDANKSSNERKVAILTTVNAEDYLGRPPKDGLPVTIAKVGPLSDQFLNTIKSPLLKIFIKEILSADGRVNPHSDVINLFTRRKGQIKAKTADQMDASSRLPQGVNEERLEALMSNPLYFLSAIKIELACRQINDVLKANNPPNTQVMESLELYRSHMYALLHHQITYPTIAVTELAESVEEAEKPLLAILDQETDMEKVTRIMKAVTVNILSLICTFGYLNYQHYLKTGDKFFYQRPKISEDLRTVDHAVVEMVTSATPPRPETK